MTKSVRAAMTAIFAGAAAFGAASSANALVINAATNQIEASGNGPILVQFDSESASHSSDLVSLDFGGAILFNNDTDPIGTTVNIGSYAAGTEIDFRLDNLTLGLSFFTGLASDNPDGVIHAILTMNADGSITVGFEDLPDGGDFDYDDLVFTVIETPIPGAAFLLLSGVAGLSFASRRKKTA